MIPDTAAFHAAVSEGLRVVLESGNLVTFGISPDRAETGYGYLELVDHPDASGAAIALRRFVEKPDASTAANMLTDGNYLWNAGIFLFSAHDIIAAFETHAPGLIAPVKDAVDKAQSDLSFLRLDPDAWAQAEDISIDCAVMEKASDLSVVPYSSAWSDLGGWVAILREVNLTQTA